MTLRGAAAGPDEEAGPAEAVDGFRDELRRALEKETMLDGLRSSVGRHSLQEKTPVVIEPNEVGYEAQTALSSATPFYGALARRTRPVVTMEVCLSNCSRSVAGAHIVEPVVFKA